MLVFYIATLIRHNFPMHGKFAGQLCLEKPFHRVFAKSLGDLGSIPGRVIPKTFKMILDTSLINIQQYKEPIKGKVEQSRERSSALSYISA